MRLILRLLAAGVVSSTDIPASTLSNISEPSSFFRVNLGPWTASQLNASRSTFAELSVHEVDFGAANLSYSAWWQARVIKSKFDKAQLRGTWFKECSFKKVSFASATMAGVHFSQSQLEGTSFRSADLTGAYFERSNCNRCDFRGADLRDVTFALTELADALFDAGTKLPFSPETAARRGMIFVQQ